MIKARSSEDYLHSDVILREISEYDIFVYYCPNFKQLGKPFCSDLRQDRKPTASIVAWKGHLLYKDFGCSDHSFSCFRYVMHKYSCDFMSALKIIDCDFNLNLNSSKEETLFTMGVIGMRLKQPKIYEKLTTIKKKRRPFSEEDEKFWTKYYISKQILVTFAVEPISYYWVNGNRFSCKSITYAFKFGRRFKIYSPLETKFKWSSNTKSTDIQGLKQLPDTGKQLFITSSLKDVMCLYAAGYSAIALQSEMQNPDEKLIKDLRARFEEIFIFYDNDYDNENNPGQTMARKICEQFNLNNICIPDKYESKDPSDLVVNVGSPNILKHIINEQTRCN
jgi:hypothetical protein